MSPPPDNLDYSLGPYDGPPVQPNYGPIVDTVCIALSCDGSCGAPSHRTDGAPPGGGLGSWLSQVPPGAVVYEPDPLLGTPSPSPAAQQRSESANKRLLGLDEDELPPQG